jgi:hypothetical protein
MASVGPFEVLGRSKYASMSAAGYGAAEGADLDERLRDRGAHGGDDSCHRLAAGFLVPVAVGRDDLLVDAPGGLDLDVLVVGERCTDSARTPNSVRTGKPSSTTLPPTDGCRPAGRVRFAKMRRSSGISTTSRTLESNYAGAAPASRASANSQNMS